MSRKRRVMWAILLNNEAKKWAVAMFTFAFIALLFIIEATIALWVHLSLLGL